ncbi:Zinc transporter [Plakobranchus ocellatus]|uniref:Zinc transporter n=1 Tax=Plakobranchus ocellatus TaxID=259542 RepID=A0AAV3YS67_9GAST|nr:Zinc transporter [Plakobranchus ocellatus]
MKVLPSDPTQECIHAGPRQGLDTRARNRLLIATVLCSIFMVGEIVGGILSNSLAIISDGVHLITDFASFMIALSALHLAQRPSSNKLNFGWHRIEILGAFMSILLLWVLTGILCYSAVLRIESNDFEIEPKILLIIAATGVFFNVVLATVLNEEMVKILDGDDEADEEKGAAKFQGSGENINRLTSSEGGGDSTSAAGSGEASPLLGQNDLPRIRKRPGNINVKAAFIHVLGDLVQSIGILSSAYIIYFKPEWKIVDPLCTFFFSFMVILTTTTIMKDIVVVLMEAAPAHVDVPLMKSDLMNVPGVVGLHNYRVWSITLDKIAVSVHLCVDPNADSFRILDDATYVLRDLHFAHESFIQLERGSGPISTS